MKIVGLLRIKNASRWIDEVLESLLRLCSVVYVFDDNSTDNTVGICTRPDVVVLRSPFDSFDECRDKTYLLTEAVNEEAPDYCMMIDGDEVLEVDGPDKIKAAIKDGAPSYRFPIPYYWNTTDLVRVDGSFGRMISCGRASLFKTTGITPDEMVYTNESYAKGGLHCGNLPRVFYSRGPQPTLSNCALWHYGYIDEDLRFQKYNFYLAVDGANVSEGGYRHIIIGDKNGPAAHEQLQHAGPLQLQTTDEVAHVYGFSKRPAECHL